MVTAGLGFYHQLILVMRYSVLTLVGITAKIRNIQFYPLKCELLIQKTKIIPLKRQIWCTRKSKNIGAVVDCNDNDVLIQSDGGSVV